MPVGGALYSGGSPAAASLHEPGGRGRAGVSVVREYITLCDFIAGSCFIQVVDLMRLFLATGALVSKDACVTEASIICIAELLGLPAASLHRYLGVAVVGGFVDPWTVGRGLARHLYQELFRFIVGRLNSVSQVRQLCRTQHLLGFLPPRNGLAAGVMRKRARTSVVLLPQLCCSAFRWTTQFLTGCAN